VYRQVHWLGHVRFVNGSGRVSMHKYRRGSVVESGGHDLTVEFNAKYGGVMVAIELASTSSHRSLVLIVNTFPFSVLSNSLQL